MCTARQCHALLSTEIAVDIWCSPSCASSTSLAAIFPVSTQTMPRHTGSPEIGHRGCFLGPGIPDHGRGGAILLDDDAASPPAIFDDASVMVTSLVICGLRRAWRVGSCKAETPRQLLVDQIKRMEPPGSTVGRRFRPFDPESSV
jgi:hypothetical protein